MFLKLFKFIDVVPQLGLLIKVAIARIVQGWPELRDLAQHVDCKSLLMASSWPTIWANPVQFSFNAPPREGSAAFSRRRMVMNHLSALVSGFRVASVSPIQR